MFLFHYTAPTVTVVSSPAGTPVSESTNTFDYPILSSVTLRCMVEPLPPSSISIDVLYIPMEYFKMLQ